MNLAEVIAELDRKMNYHGERAQRLGPSQGGAVAAGEEAAYRDALDLVKSVLDNPGMGRFVARRPADELTEAAGGKGSAIYSGSIVPGITDSDGNYRRQDMDEAIEKTKNWYANGHPSVGEVTFFWYALVDVETIQNDRSDDAVAAWHERTGR